MLMRIEKRVYELGQMNELTNVDGIVVGDEGCIYKVLDCRVKEIINVAVKNEMDIRLLTPFVPNKYVDTLFQRISEFAQLKKLKVVFNDYGMLHKCLDLIREGRIEPVLGRILTRSILDCPWSEDLLQNEEDSVAEGLLEFNFKHEEKWSVMEELQIREIELNVPAIQKEIDFHIPNVKITLHMENAIVSVGRVCFVARHAKIALPQCIESGVCDRKLYFELLYKWKKNTSSYLEPEVEQKEIFQNMFLKGNIVYRRIPEKERCQVIDNIDGYII